MSVILGFIISLVAMLGSFAAMGGHLAIIWQPFEFTMILGIGLGIFVMANPMSTIKDTGTASAQAILGKVPKRDDFIQLLGCLFALMRDMKNKSRNEVEAHVDDPHNSELFQLYPNVLRDPILLQFICDYVRLIVIGNARSFELEALMDQEIATLRSTKMKPYAAVQMVADALPAVGIIAAVLGIVKAMGAIDQSPEILGKLIAAALIGTFTGIFMSYGAFGPLAQKIKTTREKRMQPYEIVKQTLVAYLNGALPQIAVEHGRKTISVAVRPTINEVENEALGGSPKGSAAIQEAA